MLLHVLMFYKRLPDGNFCFGKLYTTIACFTKMKALQTEFIRVYLLKVLDNHSLIAQSGN